MQGEHDGPEEDRSDPEGRGAHGPARPDVRSSGEEEHRRFRSGATRRGRVRRLSEARFPPFLLFYTSVMMINMGFTRNSTRDRDLADVNVLARGGPL